MNSLIKLLSSRTYSHPSPDARLSLTQGKRKHCVCEWCGSEQNYKQENKAQTKRNRVWILWTQWQNKKAHSDMHTALYYKAELGG